MDDRLTGLWLAWGVFLSGVLQLICLVWGVWREGFSMRLRLPRLTPDVKRLLVLMAPALLTGGVVQINLLVGQIIASAQDNAISLLNFADRINQLPLGVIGVAVGVVLLPELSRALRSGDHADAEHLQNRSLEFALGLTLPAAVGLMAMPGPIVAMLYERGEFTAEATVLTAQALAAFAAGLPAYVLIKVFSPAFFAREDMKTPMWFSIVAVAVNIVASLALFPIYGHVAIALATTVSAWLNLLLLAGTLWARNDFRPSAITARRVVLIAVASFAMGALIWVLQMLLAPLMENPSGLVRLATVLAIIVAAAIAYFAIVIATGAVDRQQLIGIVRRRRRRPVEAGTPTPDPE
jgi:putative peptidoglycan lipid II flippase